MSEPFQTFREVLEFPCELEFKIIVDAARPGALKQVLACLDCIEPSGVLPISKPPRTSRKGNYLSYSVPVRVSEEGHLEQIYRQVAELDCVLHIL